MPSLDRELRRGTLEMLLLTLLGERTTYGYDLVSRLSELTEGAFEIKEGTLYPVLYRLEQAGAVEPEWRQPERGVPRKYYRITEAGRIRSEELRDAWRSFVASVDRIVSSTFEETS